MGIYLYVSIYVKFIKKFIFKLVKEIDSDRKQILVAEARSGVHTLIFIHTFIR